MKMKEIKSKDGSVSEDNTSALLAFQVYRKRMQILKKIMGENSTKNIEEVQHHDIVSQNTTISYS